MFGLSFTFFYFMLSFHLSLKSMIYENNMKTQHETRSEKFELQQTPFLLQKTLTKKLNMKTIAPTISYTKHKPLSLPAPLSYKTTHNKIVTSYLSHPKKVLKTQKNPKFLLETFTCLPQKQKQSKSKFLPKITSKTSLCLHQQRNKAWFWCSWKKERVILQSSLHLLRKMPQIFHELGTPSHSCNTQQMHTNPTHDQIHLSSICDAKIDLCPHFDVWSFQAILGIPTHVSAK